MWTVGKVSASYGGETHNLDLLYRVILCYVFFSDKIGRDTVDFNGSIKTFEHGRDHQWLGASLDVNENQGVVVSFLVRQPEIWTTTRENLFRGFANNKGADQPAHPRRLISAFVILFLESIISKLAIGESSIL